MAAPLVRAMRLTFTWVESTLDLLQSPESKAPFAFLGRDYFYEAEYARVVQHGKSDAGLMMPWPKPEGQHFWTYYLDGSTPGSLKANAAWRALVPLRMNPRLSLGADWLPGQASIEGFFYPHAIASVATFTLRAPKNEPMTLERCVELAHDVRGNRQLKLAAPDDSTEELVLGAAKDRVRDHLRTLALGLDATPGRVSQPFSVVTFLSLENVAPTEVVVEGDPVHRALQALADWSPTWQLDDLAPLATRLLSRRRVAPRSDVMFAGRRGRVIWLPKFAGDPPPSRPKLACYHRNQVLAAMQVEALGALVCAADDKLAEWDGVAAPLRECSRHAAGLLTRLLLGMASSYQSASCRRQITDAKLVDPLQHVRARHALPAITLS